MFSFHTFFCEYCCVITSRAWPGRRERLLVSLNTGCDVSCYIDASTSSTSSSLLAISWFLPAGLPVFSASSAEYTGPPLAIDWLPSLGTLGLAFFSRHAPFHRFPGPPFGPAGPTKNWKRKERTHFGRHDQLAGSLYLPPWPSPFPPPRTLDAATE